MKQLLKNPYDLKVNDTFTIDADGHREKRYTLVDRWKRDGKLRFYVQFESLLSTGTKHSCVYGQDLVTDWIELMRINVLTQCVSCPDVTEAERCEACEKVYSPSKGSVRMAVAAALLMIAVLFHVSCGEPPRTVRQFSSDAPPKSVACYSADREIFTSETVEAYSNGLYGHISVKAGGVNYELINAACIARY